MTYHAPFCVKPFGPARLEVAWLLTGGFLQEGAFIGVQHFKGVCILPNTNHLPLLGPTPTLDGTLEKNQRRMGVTWWKGDENIKGCLWVLSSIHSVRTSPGAPGKCYWLGCRRWMLVLLRAQCWEWRASALSYHSTRMLVIQIMVPSVWDWNGFF